VIAERDRSIQQNIMESADKGGSKVKIMAFLMAMFLPGTSMAVKIACEFHEA
jgi:hypothetical protein